MTPGPFHTKLMDGERVTWSGQPVQGLILRRSDILFIPFSLLFTGMALAWEMVTIREDAGPFFMLWGIPFLLVGLYLVIGRFITDVGRRSRTYYALTDSRVLILCAGFASSFIALILRDLSALRITGDFKGRSTIHFTPEPLVIRNSSGETTTQADSGPKFESIEDGDAVFARISEAVRVNRAPSAFRPD